MAHLSRDPLYYKDDGRTVYYGQISPEYQFEKPAIDRLLDYISNQESRKPAIDILIQEYLERIGSPLTYQSSNISSLMDITIENGHDIKNTCSQQTQTPTRGVQYYQSAPSFYPTPLTSGNDIMYDPNYDYRNTASTPLLPPLSTRSYRSSSIATDGVGSTPSTGMSISSNQEIPIFDRFTNANNHQDNRLKRAAAQERRQATRHFGKVQPGLIWTSPLPVRPRIFSIRPPSLSCKIFLGGIPHDLNPRDLQERLESFGLVRLEWPNKDNIPMHRNSSNHITAGFVYAVYENEESVHKILHTCSTKTDRTLDDGRCEYYLDVYSQRTSSRRKSIQIIPWFVEDSQWIAEGDYTSNGYGNWEQRLSSTECINRTVFVGALHGMMTAYALARICHELFGDVEYAAIDTDRNKYPIGSGRVVFVNAHSYYAAVTANYLMIECDKFCKVIQIDPYLSDSVQCAGVNGQWCPNMGQYFCRSLKCMKYYCATCWDMNSNHLTTQTNECEPPAMAHKPLMRNARTA
jgi:cytoplasmic polyadenylation element-binding protein